MAEWVKCVRLNSKNEIMYVNLENATMMHENGGGTRITLIGVADAYTDVKGKPEEILKLPKV